MSVTRFAPLGLYRCKRALSIVLPAACPEFRTKRWRAPALDHASKHGQRLQSQLNPTAFAADLDAEAPSLVQDRLVRAPEGELAGQSWPLMISTTRRSTAGVCCAKSVPQDSRARRTAGDSCVKSVSQLSLGVRGCGEARPATAVPSGFHNLSQRPATAVPNLFQSFACGRRSPFPPPAPLSGDAHATLDVASNPRPKG